MSDSRIAVYAGSFDPIHNGHLDIVQRCRKVFDQTIVAVLSNLEKEPTFSIDERVEMIDQELEECDDCEAQSFSGLLVDFMETVNARALVRGLRAVSDFEYEFQMALMNRRLNPEVETVFMMPREDYIYLSSRLVKEVFFLGGDLDGLVPSRVLDRLARVRDLSGDSEPR
ncbi:MAG: pantetheine-phosphate adenylyltransferase [Acidobacteria bacterium]|nr:pantetheine-phosphate adenylyltransferase [Acidobacteriota bacterium]